MTDKGNIIPLTRRPVARAAASPLRDSSRDGMEALRVLVIDDTPEDRMVVRFALEAQGFTLTEAASGEAGISAARAMKPDCILLDYRLPDYDGLEMLAELRQGDRLPCAVVMLTATSDAVAAAALMKAGALDYLGKVHLDADNLRRAVRGAVERFRLLEERRLSEARNAQLAAIVAASNDAIVSTGTDDRITSWNPGAEQLFGYREQDAIGRSIEQLVVPEHLIEQRRKLYADVSKGREAIVLTTERRRKDGSLVPVEVNASPILDVSGKVVGISVIFRDITERKRAEAALAASEERHRQLMQLLPVGVYTCKAPSGEIDYYNEQAAELWGRKPRIGDTEERFCGSHRLFLPDGSPLPHAETPIAAALSGGESFRNLEVVVERPDRTRVPVIVNIAPMRGPDGAVVGVVNAFHDITERKLAEEALQRQLDRQKLLLDVTSALIGSGLDERELGRIVYERIAATLQADVCFNYRLDSQTRELRLLFERGIPEDQREAAERLLLDQAFCGTVAASCKPINADAARVASDPKGAFVHGMGVKCYACHPLRAGDGRVLGTFSVASTTRSGFSPDEVAFLQTVSNVLAQAWERIESERTLRNVMSAAPVAIYIFDCEAMRPVLLNERARELLGYDEAVWPTQLRSAVELMHPDDRGGLAQHFARIEADRTNGLHTFEHRMRHADGGWRWFLARDLAYERGPDGRLSKVLGTATDITDRKESEEALSRRNRHLDVLARTSQLLLEGQASEQTLLERVFAETASLLKMETYFHYRASAVPQYLELRAAEGISADHRRLFSTIRYGEHLCGRVAETRARLIVEDLQNSDEPGSQVLCEAGATSYAGFPLVAGSELVGTIAFVSRHRTHFQQDEIQTVQTICDQLALTLERSRLQQELREREALLRQQREDLDQAQAVAHTGSWRLDVKRNELAWSAETHRIFGIPKGTPMTYQTFLGAVHPDDRGYVDSSWSAALAGERYDIEHRIVVEGKVKWVRERASLEVDGAGSLLSGFGTVQDITDRRQAEQALRESEQRLRAVGDNLPESAVYQYVHEPDGTRRFLHFSAGIERLIGVHPDEALRDAGALHVLIPQEYLERLAAAELESARDLTDFAMELPMRRRDGEVRWMRLQSRPRQVSSGRVIWDGVQTDVTERKQIEDDLRRSRATLSTELERMSRLQTLGARVVRGSDHQSVLEEILAAAADLTGTDKGNIQLLDPDTGELRIVAHRGLSRRFLDYFAEHGWSATCDAAMQKVERVIVEDVANESTVQGTTGLEVVLQDGIRAIQSTPLLTRSGRLLGMLSNHFAHVHRPSEADLRYLDMLARMAADLIERQQAETALRASEEFNRSLMEGSADCIKVLDLDGRLLLMNGPGLCQMEIDDFGPLCGREWSDFWPAEAHQHIERALVAARTGEAYSFQAFCPTAKGTPKYWDVTVSPARDVNGGQIVRLLSTSRDITERKQAEERLRESEQRLNLALRASATGVWELDLASDRVTWSGEIKPIFAVDEFAGTREAFARFVHPADAERLWAAVEKALESGSLLIEFRIIRADGEERWVNNQAIVIRDRAGKPVRLLGTVSDITQRKRQEEQINLLMNEVNHRAKNLLSLMLAVARQTYSSDPSNFMQRFSERVQSISASQDLLVHSQWRGIEVEALVRSQLAHFHDLVGTRVKLQGPPARLTSAAAQSIGMALHELATNAGKYGALSNDSGRVDIEWTITGNAQSKRFGMSWVERDGPPVVAPTRRGFGTTVIDAMVRNGLNGDVKLDYAPTGVQWRVDCPAATALDSEGGES